MVQLPLGDILVDQVQEVLAAQVVIRVGPVGLEGQAVIQQVAGVKAAPRDIQVDLVVSAVPLAQVVILEDPAVQLAQGVTLVDLVVPVAQGVFLEDQAVRLAQEVTLEDLVAPVAQGVFLADPVVPLAQGVILVLALQEDLVRLVDTLVVQEVLEVIRLEPVVQEGLQDILGDLLVVVPVQEVVILAEVLVVPLVQVGIQEGPVELLDFQRVAAVERQAVIREGLVVDLDPLVAFLVVQVEDILVPRVVV